MPLLPMTATVPPTYLANFIRPGKLDSQFIVPASTLLAPRTHLRLFVVRTHSQTPVFVVCCILIVYNYVSVIFDILCFSVKKIVFQRALLQRWS